MKALWTSLVACALMASPGMAVAGSRTSSVQVQASMLVTGTIVIKPNGRVASYTLDHEDKLPQGVLNEMAKSVPQWKFEPVLRGGKAVAAKSSMSVRLVARPIGKGKYAIGISGAHFGKGKPEEFISKKSITPPVYPWQAARQRVAGTVYLVLQVGRDGKVQRVAVRQVDLRTRGRPAQMKHWRQEFASSSVRAVKYWTFNLPVKGPHVDDDHWIVNMPVIFRLHETRRPALSYGRWVSYIPGPEHMVPWLQKRTLAIGSADAMPADGGLYPMRQSLHLLTSLDNGS